MVKVIANGKVIADSNEAIVVENNYYFPPSSVDKSLFTNSETRCDPPPIFSDVYLTLDCIALSVRGKGQPVPIL